MNIYDLITLSLLIALIAIIASHINTSRYARLSAKKHCAQHGLQLLDQNVVLKQLRLRRSKKQLFTIERTYYFEFSSVGDRRYSGRVTLTNKRLKHIELDVYKTQDDIDTS